MRGLSHGWQRGVRPALRERAGTYHSGWLRDDGSGGSLTGGCLCGGVRFEVADDFDAVVACHCTNCKKISGGGGTVSGRVRAAAVHVLEGEQLLTGFQPAEGTKKTFCCVCGSNIFGGGWPDAERISVRLSALDEPFERRPGTHIYVRSVAPWETLPDDGAERSNTLPARF